VALIRREDPSLISWDVTVDNREIASEMRLDLVCDPMEFRAGEVFKLVGFGPASTVTTVKLPGRWLIEDVTRNRADVFSSFTLKQPERAKPEPAGERGTLQDDPSAGEDVAGTPKNIIDTIVVPIAQGLGFEVTPESITAANGVHAQNTTTGNKSDHKGPPSQAWAADISDSSSPSPRMDKLAKALLDRFDAPVKNVAHPDATSGLQQGNLVSWESDGYRFQLIYRTTEGGNHYNHVHIGIKWLKFVGPPTPLQWDDVKDFPTVK
jgi:hypothetical protein